MKKILLTFAALTIAGCSSGPATIQEGPNAEVSFDGLHLVDNSAFKRAWADPDIDFSRYSKIMPGGAFFEYRAVKKSSNTRMARSSASEFYIDESAREKLKEVVSEVFNEELAKSARFTVVDKPGQDVLIVRGGLHDIMSRVPPDMIGRGETYLSSVGEITLILEVVDSMSGEVIARAAERRALDRAGGGMAMISNSVTTWSEVRRLTRRWATMLREGLDAVPTD
jgi:hypothetical protein